MKKTKREIVVWFNLLDDDTCDFSMMDNKKSSYSEKRDFGYFKEKSVDKVEPKFKVGDWI